MEDGCSVLCLSEFCMTEHLALSENNGGEKLVHNQS